MKNNINLFKEILLQTMSENEFHIPLEELEFSGNKCFKRNSETKLLDTIAVFNSGKMKVILFESEFPKIQGQISNPEMKNLSFEERLSLWKRLNEDLPKTDFGTILKRKELPKDVVLRKKDAEAQGVLTKKPPKSNANWCPYCADWQPFIKFVFTGSLKCVGCGTSEKEYYTKLDNGVWDKY